MSGKTSYRQWHISICEEEMALGEARDRLQRVGAKPQAVPLMVQLVENPKYRIPGFTLFHGAVDLWQHDCIHIVLGRGLLEMDEAFTIGFTMGTTNKVSTTEERLFSLVSRYLYPRVYQFGDDEIEVFRHAVRLGYISACRPLDRVDFREYLDCTLDSIRTELGLESDLLRAYYRIEKERYPHSLASARLLDGCDSRGSPD